MASASDNAVIYPAIDSQVSVFLSEQSAVTSNRALGQPFDPFVNRFLCRATNGRTLSVSLQFTAYALNQFMAAAIPNRHVSLPASVARALPRATTARAESVE